MCHWHEQLTASNGKGQTYGQWQCNNNKNNNNNNIREKAQRRSWLECLKALTRSHLKGSSVAEMEALLVVVEVVVVMVVMLKMLMVMVVAVVVVVVFVVASLCS